MKKVYFPFFLKFILIFVILSVLPLLFLSLQSNKILYPALSTLYRELHTKTIENVSTMIKSYFETISQILPLIEETVIRTDLSWENKQTMLKSIIDTNDNIVAVSILDFSGKEKVKIYKEQFLSSPILENFSETKFFIEFKNSPLQNILTNFRYEENFYQIDTFYKHKNFFIRIILSLESLFNQLERYRIGKTGFVTIISAKEKSLIFTNAEDKHLAEKLISNPIVSIAEQSTTIGSKEFKENNIDYIASYTFIPISNWVVILQQQRDEAFLPVTLLTNRATRIIFILIFVSIIISFLIATGISRPIIKIINAAKTVAAGNFNVNIKIKTFDELEILGETFNHMAQKLNEYAEIQLDKLIAEKTKTEAIIFSIQDGIILTDYAGNIMLINKKAKDILNISNTNVENLNIFNILDEKIRPVFESAINQPNKIFELDLSQGNFARFYQTMSLPVSTPKNEKIGIVTVLHDITLEKELDKMKDDFLHSITHDLRNPMTSIRGFIKFLYDGVAGPINEQQKKMLETMDRASFKLLNMINDILDISKIEAGKMELSIEKVDIVKIAQNVIELQQPQYERKNINLVFEPQKNTIELEADGKLLERVFTNLIGNAIKFTPENGTITVGIKEKDNFVESFVQDTGEGIPKGYHEKIFEKFGQVKNKAKGGTGLGLTICKYIVELHKGKIWVESEYGHGAKFIFVLPKTQNPNITDETDTKTN